MNKKGKEVKMNTFKLSLSSDERFSCNYCGKLKPPKTTLVDCECGKGTAWVQKGLENLEKEKINSDPHRPAICAMWLYSDYYIKQKGGVMDFWYSLSESERDTCRRMLEQINSTRPELDTEI